MQRGSPSPAGPAPRLKCSQAARRRQHWLPGPLPHRETKAKMPISTFFSIWSCIFCSVHHPCSRLALQRGCRQAGSPSGFWQLAEPRHCCMSVLFTFAKPAPRGALVPNLCGHWCLPQVPPSGKSSSPHLCHPLHPLRREPSPTVDRTRPI